VGVLAKHTPCLPATTCNVQFPVDFDQHRGSVAHLHFLKVVNMVGSCLNDLEPLVAAEFLRQTLESVVTDSQLS